MTEAIIEAFLDTLKTVPFLLFAYILIEYIEHKASDKLAAKLSEVNHVGPLIGGVLGIIPQCGFSVAAANFFTERVITPGTLIAVFIATSDEAIPLFLSHPGFMPELVKLILIKMAFAIVAGFITDKLLINLFDKKKNHNLHEDCDSEETKDIKGILKASLHHTLQIGLFILLINLILSVLIYFIGEDSFAKILLKGNVLQPMLTGLIGFIPNCAASVVLTELFIDGSISFGSIVAGLSTGAGIGIAVLFKNNKSIKENVSIISIIYVMSLLFGILLNMFL